MADQDKSIDVADPGSVSLDIEDSSPSSAHAHVFLCRNGMSWVIWIPRTFQGLYPCSPQTCAQSVHGFSVSDLWASVSHGSVPAPLRHPPDYVHLHPIGPWVWTLKRLY